MFSRKKIRGYNRKLNQLNSWKDFIISYDFENINSDGIIFRLYWGQIIWYRESIPNQRLHYLFFKALHEVFESLMTNTKIKENNQRIQIWLFYPRITKSIVIVATDEEMSTKDANISIRSKEYDPPQIIVKLFKEYKIRLGDDNVFKYVDNKDFTFQWKTIRKGDIWIVE